MVYIDTKTYKYIRHSVQNLKLDPQGTSTVALRIHSSTALFIIKYIL